MWRTSSFVGEPEVGVAPGRRRETTRSSIASMATTLIAPQTTPWCIVQQNREYPTERTPDRAIEQERHPHESVRCPNQPHDLDFPPSGQHGHANRGPDDDGGRRHESKAYGEADHRSDVAEPVEFLDPIAAEPNVLGEPESL